jgi:SAM-dependent methyltransferase
MSFDVYPYDLVPFHSTSVPGADCRRFEVIARLFGLTAAPCAHARVLELGCGSAANLIPLALEHPQARFIGCDLSRSALASGQRVIDGLGLTNVELRHIDICDVDDGWGCFDYILCHDVFSWVAPDVRQKILATYKRNLAARGVGHISYAALPGWRLHGIARDMMRYAAAGLSDPRQAVDRARAILAMGAAVQDQKPGPYADLLREEYFRLSAIGDEQLYHMAFSEHHQPFYFHEFNHLLGEAGLQHLSDSNATRLFGPREPVAVRAFLDALPRWDQQQCLDFLTNCSGRDALVCHRDVRVRSRPDEDVLRSCWISLATAARGQLVAPNPPIQEALFRLQARRPEFVAFSDLAENGAPPRSFFMDAYAAGMIDVALSPPCLSSRISDRPEVNPLVRLQAQVGSTVTNQKCEAVRLTDVARHVATLLDSVHSRNDVAESVAHEIESGGIADDWTLRLEDDELDVGRLTGDVLRHLRDQALLVA